MFILFVPLLLFIFLYLAPAVLLFPCFCICRAGGRGAAAKAGVVGRRELPSLRTLLLILPRGLLEAEDIIIL